MLTPNEQKAINNLREMISRIQLFFSLHGPPVSDLPDDWFAFLVQIKDELGNFNNQISFISVLMAKAYLCSHFDVEPYDAATKAQGAPGLDIDIRTKQGQRIIGEIKTTHPYKENDFGANQKKNIQHDAEKLRKEQSYARFFFITDTYTFEIMKKPHYKVIFSGIEIVHLPSGNKIAP